MLASNTIPLVVPGIVVPPGRIGVGARVADRSGGFFLPAFKFLLAAAIVLRLLAMAGTSLIPEEAYYWMYTQHPSLSYFDHPPMVAWVIALGTSIFGHTEFGVRIINDLLMFAASGMVYLFARMWFGRWVGLASAVMLHVLPVYFVIGFITTMDSALLFFWSMGLVGVTLALKRNRASGWYLAGIALGGALLSKYTGIFLAGGAGLAVLVHRPWRRHLLTVHPYLAFLLAMAMFSPVLVWNAQNDWASFRFQFMNRWSDGPLSLGPILTFVGYQLAVATPVFLAACVAGGARVIRKRRLQSPRTLIVLCFSLPLMLVMAWQSIRHIIHINWTAPAFISLLPAIAWWIRAQARLRRRQGFNWPAGAKWAIVVCTLVNVLLVVYLLTLQKRAHLLPAFGPWKELATIVEQYEEEMEKAGPEPLIVAEGKYRLASVLAFYRSPLESRVRASDFTTSQWIVNGREGLGYRFWPIGPEWNGRDVLFVDEDNNIRHINQHFDKVQVVYDSGKKYASRYQIAICRGLHRSTADPPRME